MAVFRKIETSFWQDPFILDLEPEEKYFYLYLMTNTKTSQCGIYEISKAVMQMELGIDRKRIDELLDKFVKHKKIIYSEDTHEIMILNWVKYNGSTSHTVLKRAENENIPIDTLSIPYKHYADTPKTPKEEKNEEMAINTQGNTLSIPYPYTIDTETQEEEVKEEVKEEEQEEKKNSSSNFSNKETDNNFREIAKLYQQVIGQPNALVPEWIETILTEYGFDWVRNAMLEADKRGKRTKKYIEGILQNWKTNGGMKLYKDNNNIENKNDDLPDYGW